MPPRGVERPRRVVRFARLIQRRVRAFRRTFGPRRLRRQSKPDQAASQRDGAEARWRWPRLIVIGIQARRPSQMTSVSPPVTLQARNSTTFTHQPRTVKSR